MSRLEIFYATVTAGLMVGASLWLDRNGVPVTGRITAKQERVVVGHEPSGEWRRYYEVETTFEQPGGGDSQATVRVPRERYDALRAGDSIAVRYLPQFPLLARTTDRSTATVMRELLWGLAGIPILVWLAGGLLVLWIAARLGTVPVLAAGAAWLAAGYSLLLSPPSREGTRPAQATAQVRGVTLVDKSPARVYRTERRTSGFNRRLEVPYQVVELLVPVRGGRDTVLAVDAVDSGSVAGLAHDELLPVRLDPAAPRDAQLVAGTRRFLGANRYHFLIPVVGCGILGTLAALTYRWRRRKRQAIAREDTMAGAGAATATGALLLLFGTGSAAAQGQAAPTPALGGVEAQAPAGRIPMGTGATIVQTLSTATADRESVHRVRLASDSGLHYEWLLEEVHDTGDTLRQEFRYLEAWADLADAKRVRFFHDAKAPEAHPGYTMHALSRATYRRLRANKADSLQIMYVDETPGSAQLRSLGFGGARVTPVRWRGTIAPAAPNPVLFPVLLNGRRVQLRALHLRGDFTARQGRWQPQLWVLADSAYPLILKWVGAFRETSNVLQTTRIDLPFELATVAGVAGGDGVLLVGREALGPSGEAIVGSGADAEAAAALEGELATSCRVELPGIYFAFNSAHVEPASDRAIATLAGILARHPEWTATLEGHTDSIGSGEANKALSERRVEAVRARLIEQHRVMPGRLRVAGFGAARPREPNGTIEGRARNRRVELVRDCAAAG